LADARCIADCADQTSCADLTAAAAAGGIEGNWYYNSYAKCASKCQCRAARLFLGVTLSSTSVSSWAN